MIHSKKTKYNFSPLSYMEKLFINEQKNEKNQIIKFRINITFREKRKFMANNKKTTSLLIKQKLSAN